jgi:hypothetical protein
MMDTELWQKGFAEGSAIPVDRAVELAVQALEVIKTPGKELIPLE